MNSRSVKQKTSLMFVTLKCYGSPSPMSLLLITKENFCSRFQIESLASAGECSYECKWVCSRVQLNLLASTHELARGYGLTCSRVRANLLASTSEFTRECTSISTRVHRERVRRCIWAVLYLVCCNAWHMHKEFLHPQWINNVKLHLLQEILPN